MASKKKQKSGPVNVNFASTYEGCQVVANMMGLNVETVRKKAKAGTLPAAQNDKGTWVFDHNALVLANVEPFAGAGYIGTTAPRVTKPAPKMNITEVFFVLDGSGSMAGLLGEARKNLESQVETLKKAAGPNDLYNITIINFGSSVRTSLRSLDVDNLNKASSYYQNDGGMTALNDAIAEAINQCHTMDDGSRAFLISVVTDGQENQSSMPLHRVAEAVRAATAKDRYTFVYAGPNGSQSYANSLSIPAGNITAWDQTIAGAQSLGTSTVQSLGTYSKIRSTGVMRSTSFYAQPTTTDASKFADKLDSKLDDVTQNVKVVRVDNKDPVVINKFCEKKFGTFEKGKYYYQLTESEKVQDYKKVVIQDTATGSFYSGWAAAKKLLNIPEFQGTVHIKPGNLGDFKVFIQSTSVNRKLVPGTAVVYLPT